MIWDIEVCAAWCWLSGLVASLDYAVVIRRQERAHHETRANMHTKARSPPRLDHCKAVKRELTPSRDKSANMRHFARTGFARWTMTLQKTTSARQKAVRSSALKARSTPVKGTGAIQFFIGASGSMKAATIEETSLARGAGKTRTHNSREHIVCLRGWKLMRCTREA